MGKERFKSKRRRIPLEKEIKASKNPGILKAPKEFDFQENKDEDDPSVLPSAISKKILEAAENQKKEEMYDAPKDLNLMRRKRLAKLKEEEEELDNFEDEAESELLGAEYDEEQEIEISPEDEKALELFMPSSVPKRRTLADIIMEAIKKKEEGGDVSADNLKERLDSRIVDVYSQIGRFLSFYRSGKVPKAFKVIPALKNWEEVLYLTEPENWTANAVFVATRLFSSGLKEKMAQRFYNLILLPRIQKDIQEHKKLNYHLYQALKRALFKPAAFFKGIILPLAEESDSLREGVIISSILAKCSIPVMHASVTLLKLTELPNSAITVMFIKTLLGKKYNLPYKIIDALVNFFHSFVRDSRTMPVIWHQSVLIFVQRYKLELTAKQRNMIKELLRVHSHHLIAAEIKRELSSVLNVDDKPMMQSSHQSKGQMEIG